MEGTRNSFVFRKEWYDAIRELDDDSKLEVYNAIAERALFGKEVELSKVGKFAMKIISPKIDKDVERWNEIRLARSEAGKRHKGNQHTRLEQNGTNVPKMEQESQIWNKMEQNGTNGTVYISKDTNVSMLDNNKKEEKVSKKSSLDLSAVSADMIPIVEDWLAYKSEKKQSYKQIGFNTFYKNLCKLSDNNPVIARAIIDQSIGNNYSGIFGLKNGAQYSNISYPHSIEDVREDDLCDSYNAYVSLMERKCYKMKESIGNGFPQTNSELMRLIEITKGGARGFTYVFLVLNRDGWDKYYDERGFMWIYYNYIKANGLFIG